MDGSKYARVNPDTGLIELYDVVSGRLLGVERHPSEIVERSSKLVERRLSDGTVLRVPEGMADEELSRVERQRWPYSEAVAAVICEYVTNGEALTKVCKYRGMPPYNVVARWREAFPDFDERLMRAYQARAEWFGDKVIEEADGLSSDAGRDEVSAMKARVDAYKWLASKGNARQFGDKMEVSGKVESVHRLVIDTGIRREGDEGYFPDEARRKNMVDVGSNVQSEVSFNVPESITLEEVAYIEASGEHGGGDE